MSNPIGIGLIGAGVVGGGVIKVLDQKAAQLSEAAGVPVVLRRVADKATHRFLSLPVGDAICTESATDVLDDENISVVVELIGGTGFAREVVLSALSRKKHVVTANKALIAEYGAELFETAQKNGVSIYFEAAVGGAIPVIKSVREAFVSNGFLSVQTIINGTCNYILTKMTDKGEPFENVLREAQSNGYAEADPTLDIGGGDSGHKVAILASLLYRGYIPFSDMYIEGITGITGEDIQNADALGYRIKLLGIIKKGVDDQQIDVRVHPAMLRKDHILASVGGVYNAVFLEGDNIGQSLLYGRGAGELPTASAVVGDIVDVAISLPGLPRASPCITTANPGNYRSSPSTTLSAVTIFAFALPTDPVFWQPLQRNWAAGEFRSHR
jgi:homoserine dehydrogenase